MWLPEDAIRLRRAMEEGRAPEKELENGLKGLVFDIDGVFFDSRTSNIEYYNIIRRAVQLPHISQEDEEFCHQASVKECLERIIPPAYRQAAEEACRRINYMDQLLPMLALEPGFLEVLHWLQSWDVRLAVFTNRSTAVGDLLRYFGLEDFFLPVKTAANSPPKPNPEGLLQILREWGLPARQIAFLGDSKVDELAAQNAGVPFWAFRNASLNARLHFDDYFTMISLITPLVEGRHKIYE